MWAGGSAGRALPRHGRGRAFEFRKTSFAGFSSALRTKIAPSPPQINYVDLEACLRVSRTSLKRMFPFESAPSPPTNF